MWLACFPCAKLVKDTLFVKQFISISLLSQVKHCLFVFVFLAKTSKSKKIKTSQNPKYLQKSKKHQSSKTKSTIRPNHYIAS